MKGKILSAYIPEFQIDAAQASAKIFAGDSQLLLGGTYVRFN
jgi:hypothetical protein